MEKHFKIRKDLSMKYFGHTLYRIEATKDLPDHASGMCDDDGCVKEGDLGGWVEKEENLQGNAWISDEAKVFDNAIVCGNAHIEGYAEVYGTAQVWGDACICYGAKVYGNARVYGNAQIDGAAQVYGDAQIAGDIWVNDKAEVYGNAQVFGNAQISDGAKVYGGALVTDRAKVYGDAQVFGNAEVLGYTSFSGDYIKDPGDCKNITGEKYNITITPNYIQIGCNFYTKEEWWSFADKEIITIMREEYAVVARYALEKIRKECLEMDYECLEMEDKERLEWWHQWKPILQLICKTQTTNQ